MSGHFELMDLMSGNIVGDYSTQAEALEVVREALVREGIAAIEHLGLASVEGDETNLIASDDDLLSLAASVFTQPADHATS